jgi:hypothetical protein
VFCELHVLDELGDGDMHNGDELELLGEQLADGGGEYEMGGQESYSECDLRDNLLANISATVSLSSNRPSSLHFSLHNRLSSHNTLQ